MAKQFRINENGICTNADQYGTKTTYISVALFPDGKWRFGATWNSFGANYSGGVFGCGFGYKGKAKDLYAFDTERACIIAGVKYIEDKIARYTVGKNGDCSDMREAVNLINAMLQPKQLTILFQHE